MTITVHNSTERSAATPKRFPPSEQATPTQPLTHEAAQIGGAIDRLSRASIGLAFVAGCLLWFFWSSDAQLYAGAVFAFAGGLAAFAVVARSTGQWATASRRQLRAARALTVLLAAASAMVWGSMPVVLFAGAKPDERLVIVAAMAAVALLAACFTTTRLLSLINLVPVVVGSAAGFALGQSQGSLVLAALSPAAGWLLWRHALRSSVWEVERRAIAGMPAPSANAAEAAANGDESGFERDWVWHTDGQNQMLGDHGGLLPASVRLESLFRLEGASTKGAQAVIDAMGAQKAFRNELVEIIAGERSGWWHLSGKPLFGADGAFIGFQGKASDATSVLASEARIARLSNFDALTGLANRQNFRDFAAMQCAEAASDGRCRALLYLDVDDFKTINDTFGFEQADHVLRGIGTRIAATVPRGAFPARLGGDEFAVWLLPTTPSKAEACAMALIEAIGAPMECAGTPVTLKTSVGIVFAPRHSLDADDLLSKADLALYSAKQERRGRICVFAPGVEKVLVERRKLEGDLRRALARHEFVLYYQPIVDVATGRVSSFEALIRWQSPERGFVSPADFIPLAESTGLITPIGRWVLTEACRTAATWPKDVRVAVNISPPHLRSADFLGNVTAALQESGLDADRLVIEVTEGVLIDQSFAAAEKLQKVRSRGIRIALDDFGTGYSSFNYLIDFPVDKIKIDRSFVRGVVESSTSQAIIEAILGLARRLSIRVTAEGVETKAQAMALKRLRCDEMQGFLLSRSCPAEEVASLIGTVPALFRDAVPTYMDSPLGIAIASKKGAAA